MSVRLEHSEQEGGQKEGDPGVLLCTVSWLDFILNVL